MSEKKRRVKMFGCVNIDENGLLHKIYADISLQHIFITYALRTPQNENKKTKKSKESSQC